LNALNSSVPESQFLLLYTAPGKNPSYRQGVLDAICYPNKHLISYSYRRKNVPPFFLAAGLKPLVGKPAVIIFVDFDKDRGATYFPLRKVNIHSAIEDSGTSTSIDDRERVRLFLELGDFVEYRNSEEADQWNSIVQSFDDLREFTGKTPKFFVVSGEDKFKQSTSSPLLAWEEISRALSQSKDFRGATFLRLNDLIKHSRGWFDWKRDRRADRKPDGDRLVYQLRPGQIYRLDMSVLEDDGLPSANRTKLEVRASAKDSLDVDQPHQSCVSGLSEKSALIMCKRSIETITTTIAVRTEQPAAPGLVNCASPTFFVRIRVSLPILTVFLILVFLGGFLVSIDTDFLRELWIRNWPVITTFFCKLIGAGMLAGAAYLAFHKLPSSQK
jgi:hypothetical protein